MSAIATPQAPRDIDAPKPKAPLTEAREAEFNIRVDKPGGKVHRALWVPDYEQQPLLVPACGVPISPRYPAQWRLTRVDAQETTCAHAQCRVSPRQVPRLPPAKRQGEQEPLW